MRTHTSASHRFFLRQLSLLELRGAVLGSVQHLHDGEKPCSKRALFGKGSIAPASFLTQLSARSCQQLNPLTTISSLPSTSHSHCVSHKTRRSYHDNPSSAVCGQRPASASSSTLLSASRGLGIHCDRPAIQHDRHTQCTCQLFIQVLWSRCCSQIHIESIWRLRTMPSPMSQPRQPAASAKQTQASPTSSVPSSSAVPCNTPARALRCPSR